jgi:hypothetical protein
VAGSESFPKGDTFALIVCVVVAESPAAAIGNINATHNPANCALQFTFVRRRLSSTSEWM